MTLAKLDSSSRLPRRAARASAASALAAAALAGALAGCMRANTSPAPAAAAQVHTLVAAQKKGADGQTVTVPLAEEYRAVRPADATPAIPPSETWPAQ